MTIKPYSLKTIANRLNRHADQFSAGFYTVEGRRFRARVRKGVLQFLDWDRNCDEVWTAAVNGTRVWDHHGRAMLIVGTGDAA